MLAPPKNEITRLRMARGMSGRELAEDVGICPRHLQRIEESLEAPKHDVAVRIAAKLSVPLHEVFPRVARVVRSGHFRSLAGKPMHVAMLDAAFARAMEEAGIDMSPTDWWVEIGFRGGGRERWPVGGLARRSIPAAMDCGDFPLVGFVSEGLRVLFNADLAASVRFLEGSPSGGSGCPAEVRVLTADGSGPVAFPAAGDDDACVPGEDRWQPGTDMARLLREATDHARGKATLLRIPAADGGFGLFRADDVAFIEVPLWATDPAFRDRMDAPEDDGDNAA